MCQGNRSLKKVIEIRIKRLKYELDSLQNNRYYMFDK